MAPPSWHHCEIYMRIKVSIECSVHIADFCKTYLVLVSGKIQDATNEAPDPQMSGSVFSNLIPTCGQNDHISGVTSVHCSL